MSRGHPPAHTVQSAVTPTCCALYCCRNRLAPGKSWRKGNSMEMSYSGWLARNLHRIIFGLAAILVWAASLFLPPARAQSTDTPTFHINSQRLQGTLEKLSEFGRNPEGDVTRLGFSETDLAARTYITGLMRQA